MTIGLKTGASTGIFFCYVCFCSQDNRNLLSFSFMAYFTILLSLVGIKSKDANSRPGQTIFSPENQKYVKFPSYIRHIFEIMYKRKKIQLNKPCMSTLKNALFIQL